MTPTVLSLIQEGNGCAAWRVAWPADALRQRGYPVAWGYVGEPVAAKQVEFAQLVVLQRACWRPGDEEVADRYLQWLHDGGRLLGYETDDDLYSPEIIERVRKTGDAELNSRSDERLEAERLARIYALQLADGVTASTEALAAVCRQYTDKMVKVVPNAVDWDRFRAAIDAAPPRPSGYPLTIGWAGGNRPDRDADALAVAWGRIARRFPYVRFLVGGYPLGVLLNSVPSERLTYIAKQPLSSYPVTYSLIDIGCCPLADETFNRSKSPIKAMEFAAAGAAVIASPTVYSDLIFDGYNGLIAHDADEWEAGLAWLIDEDGMREYLAGQLAATVRWHHSLSVTVERWPAAWASLVDASHRQRPVTGSLECVR